MKEWMRNTIGDQWELKLKSQRWDCVEKEGRERENRVWEKLRMKWMIFQEELDRQVEFTDLYPDFFNPLYHFTLCVYMIKELGGIFYGNMVSYLFNLYFFFNWICEGKMEWIIQFPLFLRLFTFHLSLLIAIQVLIHSGQSIVPLLITNLYLRWTYHSKIRWVLNFYPSVFSIHHFIPS